MDSLLEQQRRRHEEVERLENAIVHQFLRDVSTRRQRLHQQHIVNDYLTRLQTQSQDLQTRYADKDGTLAQEIKLLKGPDEMSTFYNRLDTIREYHKKFPSELVEPIELAFLKEQEQYQRQEETNITVVDTMFSGEEGMGKHLDLHEQYDLYRNLKDVPALDYLAYISKLDDFAAIRQSSKNQTYRDYLQSLATYLEGYFHRAFPLFNLPAYRERARKTFDEAWAQGRVPGWQGPSGTPPPLALFCVACRKQYSKKTVYDAHLGGRKHKKAACALAERAVPSNNPNAEAKEAQREALEEHINKDQEIAWRESLIAEYLTQLKQTREDTRANIERKQALTEQERNAENQEEEVDVDQYVSDDEAEIYNPLNLPLDWDGKPIPYWLYKLHGLSVNYSCEICGNQVYRGHKAFDKHFQEWRHAHGLRCLGIPNNRQFYGITSIADAQALWDKIKGQKQADEVQQEKLEEYEDSAGNVFNKKTFEDLKRQGLL
ncbi:Pre-mRNA-splicing factor sap61 [Dispira simplex]|nr:Pre-mRNA-splicing factor sap61 [Dispira simplex]